MAPRSQPYRVEWPLNQDQARNIDEMFQILFDDIRNGALSLSSTQLTGIVSVPHGGTGLSALTANTILYGGGSTLNLLGVNSTATKKYLSQVSSGAPAWSIIDGGDIGTGQVGLARGGTNADLSATGGTSQVLKQVSIGAAITVARLSSSDLSDSSNFALLNAANVFSNTTGQEMKKLILDGSASGTLTVITPAAAGTNTLTFPAGTTDFSATGGSNQVVKQNSAGGAFTVGTLASSNLSDGSNIALLNAGNAFTASGQSVITSANADTVFLTLRNTNNGSSATTKAQVGNDVAANRGEILNTSSTIVASGSQNPDQITLQGRGTNGVAITGVGTVPISFYVNSVLVGQFKGADGTLTARLTQNFSWNSKSADTVYQAASDGFVVVRVSLGGAGGAASEILSDSANPPTTSRTTVSGAISANIPMCSPVRQGDFYKVTTGANTISSIYWVPLGTAG